LYLLTVCNLIGHPKFFSCKNALKLLYYDIIVQPKPCFAVSLNISGIFLNRIKEDRIPAWYISLEEVPGRDNYGIVVFGVVYQTKGIIVVW
jgi:hypothetical protein